MARVQVSFKNNDKELKLYDEVMRAYDKSAFIIKIWNYKQKKRAEVKLMI